jgi:hypothetical protein
MRGSPPIRPDGSDKAATFMRAVWNKLWGKESRFCDSDTIKVNERSGGISWNLAKIAGGGTSAPSGIAMYQLASDYSDAPTGVTNGLAANFIVCRLLGGGPIVKIAKPPNLQNYGNQNWAGDNYTFDYTDTQTRKSTNTTTVQVSTPVVVTPPYTPNCHIVAATVPAADVAVAGVTLTLVDLNVDARCWDIV